MVLLNGGEYTRVVGPNFNKIGFVLRKYYYKADALNNIDRCLLHQKPERVQKIQMICI